MSKFKFDKLLNAMEHDKIELMQVLAKRSLAYWDERFVKQDWDGKKWQTPQRQIPGTNAYKYPMHNAKRRQSRAILTGTGLSPTGRLRRNVATSAKTINGQMVRFVVTSPYAAIHNNGGELANGGKMPQRQFMGFNKELNDKLIKAIEQFIKAKWPA
ncbi:COG5005 Mu-like prophage protein gpG [uncultured Caudovirales phage]|uniref:COG5005 Mu-like prophage protein gpG n=1 Tax=uncultured Caudovirales phage TaxID=2100421 RepID=A0A6J5P9X1_9CAUD|nr:COG5005 Mu-like prophage protein gpG [uncultured Caudovirales phage]CAB4168680.1 COG5005 Mu-like prophage protein gpG [uncultured Caudovirales phage]